MIRLRAVGECCIEVGAERVGPEAELAFAVLLVVVLAQGRPVPRRQLVDLLWPATSERRARHNLRQALYKLRQVGVPLHAESHDVRLPPGAIRIDPLLEADPDAPLPPELLRPDIPFGEYLAGYRPAISEAFGRWVEERREAMHGRLRRLVLGALIDERRRGSWGAVETLARKALQLDPLNEEATLALAEATALTGSKRAAIAILDGYLQELGADEEAELRLPASLLRRRIADRLLPTAPPGDTETRMVGRAESMAVLHDHFQRVRQGTGQALLVWGEQGIGKSRLLAEFSALATLDGARVVRVPCQARDVERPLSIWVDGVPELQRLPGSIGCSPESMSYLKRLTDHDPDMLEPSAATREAELLFAGVRRAILDLLDAVAEESPVVLWVEDVHWLDAQSWRVLREVIEWIERRALFVVLTSRLPHATPTVPGRGAVGLELHQVPELPHSAVLDMMIALAKPHEVPAAFRDWCLQVAGGNPLHLRALVQHWVDTGEFAAPASLQALFVARLTRLSQLPLRVLQVCAVLGKNATSARLEAVLEYRRHALLNSLALLENEGLITPHGAHVPCKHSLIADAAVSMLPAAAYRSLQYCAARVLQTEIEQSQSASMLWDCALHWKAAEHSERALKLIRSCASHLLEIGLPGDAAEVLEHAITLCETSGDRLDMHDRWADALFLGGKWERLKFALTEASVIRTDLEEHTDRHDYRELLLLEAEWRTGRDMQELLVHAEACTADFNASPNHRLDAAGASLILADNLCDATAARRIHERVGSLLEDDSLDASARLRVQLIFNSIYGDIRTALASADGWIRLEREAGNPARLARALRSAATPFRLAGMTDRAFRVVLESFSLSARYHLASSAVNSADILATMNVSRRDVVNARLWYERAVQWLRQAEEPTATASVRRVGARISLEAGDWRTARSLLDLSESQLSTDSAVRRRVEGYALYTHCLILEQPGAIPASVLDEYVDNHRLSRAMGGQDYAASVLFRALFDMGRDDDARALQEEYLHQYRREQGPAPDPI